MVGPFMQGMLLIGIIYWYSYAIHTYYYVNISYFISYSLGIPRA